MTKLPVKPALAAGLLTCTLFGIAPALAQPDPAMPVYQAHDTRSGTGPRVDGSAWSLAQREGTTRQIVSFETREMPGTILIDTQERSLVLVLADGKAVRYAVGVGREGFEWTGTEKVSRKAEWPSWRPPAAMRKRQPYLPSFMPGGPNNPMGARAIYLGATLYRIHGTTEAESIGQAMSSGCIRMMNEDVIDLYQRVRIGAKVVVS